jgi:hypothetical protein
MTEMTKLFTREVIPNILWVQILQENSYPITDEYDFSRRSPGEIVPGYDFSNFLGTISPGYDFFWVQLLQKLFLLN